MKPPPQLPSMADILSDTDQHPWTLSGFTAYLSQHCCLENLEFITEASQYRAYYERSTAGTSTSTSSRPDWDGVCERWRNILDSYITADGRRGINLPCNIRDHLSSFPYSDIPPHPSGFLVSVAVKPAGRGATKG